MEESVVSVIIPVYNASNFIEKAVNSVLSIEATLEVILIEDGSEDQSLEICKKLEKKKKVKLFQHTNNINKGPGASRNLGIRKAKGRFIAFLDADDYFFENRFINSLSMLKSDKTIDAVHEVISVVYYSDTAKERHLLRMKVAKNNIVNKILPLEYTGIEEIIEPKNLYFHLLKSDKGWIHLDGLLIRSKSLNNFRLFSNSRLGQDSEFITRLALEKKLVGTNNFSPVAARGVHLSNRILNITTKYQSFDWSYWLNYSFKKGVRGETIQYLILRTTDHKNKGIKFIKMLILLAKRPRLIPSCF